MTLPKPRSINVLGLYSKNGENVHWESLLVIHHLFRDQYPPSVEG